MAAKPEKLDPVWDNLDRCAHAAQLPQIFSNGRLVANRPTMQDHGAHDDAEAAGRANVASQRANCS